jgi:hypothetical protein
LTTAALQNGIQSIPGKLAAAHITQQATGAGVTPHDAFTSTRIVGVLQPSSRVVDC